MTMPGLSRTLSAWNWDPECTQLSQLKEPASTYPQTVLGLVVSINFQNPAKIYITDLTSNVLLGSNYVFDNQIGHTEQVIPVTQVLQLQAYEEKFGPFRRELKAKRKINLELLPNQANLVNEAIFIRADVKIKKYGGFVEGTVKKMELIDTTNFNASNRVYENVIKGLPFQYVQSLRRTFEKTIPPLLVTRYLNERSDRNQDNQVVNNPVVHQNVAVQSSPLRTPERSSKQPTESPLIKRLSIPELPSDSMFEDDYSNSVIASEPSEQPATRPTEPPKKKIKISANYIRRLNNIEEVDGKVYDVSGYIVEFEPLLSQLCIKYDLDEPPILNPLTILISATISNESVDPDENTIVKVSFNSRSEIFMFLGMTELEEVYVRSKEIYETFAQILKSKKIFNFRIMKKLIKINNDRNFMLGWGSVDLTLQKLKESS